MIFWSWAREEEPGYEIFYRLRRNTKKCRDKIPSLEKDLQDTETRIEELKVCVWGCGLCVCVCVCVRGGPLRVG